MIATGLVGVGVAVAVSVGSGVMVAVGIPCVGVSVPVGKGVIVGNGVGTKAVDVGNGVKVGKSKLNKGVGVSCVPCVGKRTGLDTELEGVRGRNQGIRLEQTQQNTSRNKPGRRILPHCPCWRYAVLNASRYELTCLITAMLT
jgi:hypothetical protein